MAKSVTQSVRSSTHVPIVRATEDKNGIDVVVIGGGLACLATSIHLARAGLSVNCVHSDEFWPDPVGESLDWSAPDLLRGIGLPTDTLVQLGIATLKQHVTLQLLDGSGTSLRSRCMVG